MLFNSYEFIFAFLPVTVVLYYVAGLASRRLALTWLVLASLFFYAWWRPVNVLIIAPSILINYVLARWLLALGQQPAHAGRARWVLALGITFNVLFLGYFKYANFVTTAVNDVAGTDFVLTQIVLPLGISFITFQKIAFLIDVHGGRVREFSFRDYCLFVLFFPQLIAGPIVHFREVMPQFRASTGRFESEHLAVGLTLFLFGLFKKAVLADGIAEYVTPVFDAAAAGHGVTFFPAWLAALGFTLQIYFDFSGYSDMALGLARCFGVRLPANFDSPLKATNIIDFWLRWHMTLTRFLTAYIYNPIALALTRRRLAAGKPPLRGRNSEWGAFVQLLALPTLLTMLISGLWHGAGYLFLLWGLLHGVYLCVNHAWRLFGRPGKAKDAARLPALPAFLLTFLAVVAAMVLFRSTNGTAASTLLSGMAGLNGIALPNEILARAGPLGGALAWLVTSSTELSAQRFVLAFAWVFMLLFIALALPNTLQIMARVEPALGVATTAVAEGRLRRWLVWTPSLRWACLVCMLCAVAVMRLGGKSEFLYWQF